ncbi:MAG: alpha/beta fold hydrolase [Bacteroidia bacterium]
MKKLAKKILIIILSIVAAIFILGLIIAFLPAGSTRTPVGISPEEAAAKRQNFTQPHHLITTSDGETLFLRQWNPDSIEPAKQNIAVLILHGVTAHSGAYQTAGKIIANGGYTTFGIDYRGHGLSGGNRADYSGKDRWIADLSETVHFIKELGYSKVIIMGHSLGVGAAIYTAKNIPEEIVGLMLLSGAYEGRKGVREEPSLFQKAQILASSVVRPSHQVVEYYRDGMTGTEDPLFNFRYTLRFLTMLKMEELILPEELNIPTLVAVGDKDELFEVEKVKELYDLVPGDQKEFLVLPDTYHARFPNESWEKLVDWLDANFSNE